MTKEQLNIQAAAGKLIRQIEQMRDQFLKDAVERPEDFEDIDINDAYVWLIEGL